MGNADVEDARGEAGVDRQRAIADRHRTRQIALQAVQETEAVQSPFALELRGVAGQLLQDRAHFRDSFRMVAEPDRVAIGLGLAINQFRAQADQGVEIAILADEPPAGFAAHARGEREPILCLDDLSGDSCFLAEPAAQQFPHLVGRRPGIGDVDLEIVLPIVGIRGTRARRLRLCLQLGQRVEHLSGDDLAGQPLGSHGGRHAKALDDERVGPRGANDNRADQRDEGEGSHRQDRPQCRAHHFANVAHAQLDALGVEQVGLLFEHTSGNVGQRPTRRRARHRDIDRVRTVGKLARIASARRRS